MNALPFGYRPLGWKVELTADDYLAHMRREFVRLSIDPHNDLLQFTDIWRSLRHDGADARNSIQRYIDWAIREKQAETDQPCSRNEFSFRVGFRLNQMGNLTVTWDPDEETFGRFGLRGNHSTSVGGTRPPNELVHIKEFHYLRFPIDDGLRQRRTRLPTSSETLASDLLSCARKRVEQVIEDVQREVNASAVSALEFELRDSVTWSSPTPVEKLVVGWRIVQHS